MIYFVRSGDFVKIGYTGSMDPKERVNDMQTGNPQKLELLFCVSGGYKREAFLHNYFFDYKSRGEWFRIDGKLKKHLEMGPLFMPQLPEKRVIPKSVRSSKKNNGKFWVEYPNRGKAYRYPRLRCWVKKDGKWKKKSLGFAEGYPILSEDEYKSQFEAVKI